MSSFRNPHHMYLFLMNNGKRKLSYGTSSDDAYSNLQIRLTDEEMKTINKDDYIRVHQREIRKYIPILG